MQGCSVVLLLWQLQLNMLATIHCMVAKVLEHQFHLNRVGMHESAWWIISYRLLDNRGKPHAVD